jgi:hypothetical protein
MRGRSTLLAIAAIGKGTPCAIAATGEPLKIVLLLESPIPDRGTNANFDALK